jgi:hypothetical protein
MRVLLTLLDANLKLHKHAGRALEKAVAEQRFAMRHNYLLDEHAFFQAYIALREVEVRELRLLHETALLSQLLLREEAARETEKKLEKTFKAQEEGNGKQAVIVSKKDLKKQEKTVNKDRKLVHRNAEAIVEIFLAQHEAIVRADRLFRVLDSRFVLLHPRADRKILKTYARVGDSAHKLRKQVVEEVLLARPLDLAHALETHRRKMRHHMTKLSQARRHFTTFIHQRLPMIGAL